MQCSICSEPVDSMHPDTGEVYWTGGVTNEGTEWIGQAERGHNAEPVNDGRCCTVCNDTVVIPARINLMERLWGALTS